MVQIGGHPKFPGWSGIIESLQNSLTLRPSSSGNVIIARNGLLPETDVLQNLGREDLRWAIIHASSGTFDARPTVGGVSVALVTDADADTQTSINGLSGTLALLSPDLSINIANSGSAGIEISIPNSGAPSGASYLLVEYNDNDHLTDARILSATSGVRVEDQGARSGSGLVVTLDFDNEPAVNQVLKWNGTKLIWADDNTVGGSASRTFTPSSGLEFVLNHGLGTVDWTWSMWRTDGAVDEILIPDNIYPSGTNDAVVQFTSSEADPSGYEGRVVFTS